MKSETIRGRLKGGLETSTASQVVQGLVSFRQWYSCTYNLTAMLATTHTPCYAEVQAVQLKLLLHYDRQQY